MTEIRSIGSETYGENSSKPFQSLETLCFEDLPEWKHWEPIDESDHDGILPHLSNLSILKCPNLIGKLPSNLPSLKELVIRECPQLVVLCSSLPVQSNLDIDGSKEIVSSNPVDVNPQNPMTLGQVSEFGNWLKQGYQKVERLSIIDCEKLIYLWQSETSLEKPSQGLHSCSSLKTLCIQDSPTLVSFLEDSFLLSLSELEIINCHALTSLPEGMKHENTSLERLQIEGCHSLAFIVKGQLPPSLKQLSIKDCEKLQFLFGDTEEKYSASTSLLEDLCIKQCPSLTCISPRGQLPMALTQLKIRNCSKLESIAERFDSNMSIRTIFISVCEHLNSLPEGLCNLNRLYQITVTSSNLVSFPEGGLPNTNLFVFLIDCETLKALPDGIHNLSCLQALSISGCPSIKSFPEEGFPTSLRILGIGGNHEIYKPLKGWGLHKFTCLTTLWIHGCPDAVSFPEDEIGMTLPTSLIDLHISEFPKLKYLSSRGFRDLTSLGLLRIYNCPKLTSFPEDGLPTSLVQLQIRDCPLLKKQCKRDKGREWSKIANMPFVEVDSRFIYEPEEDE
ncbi:putative disease resistance protein At3g14460 [Pistacia vera]|uniref:putative disease resistance protein At3g14460 n=1 Tax=Pistacia vera TaxID=55513 RepID=UPI001263818F|nr:putative disease resistance protein At3g14460 [Pistacia vera]